MVSVAAMQDIESTGSTNTVMEVEEDQHAITAATLDDQNPTGSGETVREAANDQEPINTAAIKTEQDSLDSASAVTAAIEDQESESKASTKTELTFQSLFETKEANKSPPGSPGSATSINTLVNPQSRKVSPISVQDFAYPASGTKHVLDSVAIIEEETKKELLKQLRKKTASEAKIAQKAESLIRQVKALSADLKAAKADSQKTTRLVDLAKAEASALTLSNVMLREVAKDLSLELRRVKRGAQVQQNQSNVETTGNQVKEGSNQNHVKPADENSVSAYGRMQQVQDSSVERSQGLDGLSEDNTLISATKETPPEIEVAGSEAAPEEHSPSFFDKYGLDPASLSAIFSPSSPSVQQLSDNMSTEEVSQAAEAINELRYYELDSVPDIAGQATSQDTQQRVFETDAEKEEEFHKENRAQEDPTVEESVMHAIQSPEYGEGVVTGREGFVNANFELSDAAGPATLWGIIQSDEKGPATLWGILQSDETETGAEERSGAVEEVDGGEVTDGGETASVSEVLVPVIMETVLQSEQGESEVDDQDGAGVETADTTEVEVSYTSILCGEPSPTESTAVSSDNSTEFTEASEHFDEVSNHEDSKDTGRPRSLQDAPPEGSVANGGEVFDQSSIPTDAISPPPPPASLLSEVEVVNSTVSVPNTETLTKTQKRKLERKRAQAKKAEEAAVRRGIEVEAVKAPEAEEPESLGQKRLRLQLARDARDQRLVGELGKFAGR